MKRTLFICAAVIFCISLVGVNNTEAKLVQVQVGNFFFSPQNVTIAYGDTVRWVWDGGISHSTTSDAGSGKTWDSGVHSDGGYTFDLIFLAGDGPGPFPYHCILHPSMTGTVFIDNDNDGYTADIDCDDTNPDINPGATEFCNGVDDDCDGLTDDDDPSTADARNWYPDNDGDAYGDGSQSPIFSCTQPADYVEDNTDCHDGDPNIHPGATDIPGNGIDEDCDGVDAGGTDSDGDGYTSDVDCDDTNPDINPGATELCNGVDDDCDGLTDADDPSVADASNWYLDSDKDGFGDSFQSPIVSCSQPSGHVSDNSDCDDSNPAINPAATDIPGNGIDEDCDGVDAGGGTDADGDGYNSDVDCDDNDPDVNPGQPESLCDGKDNDCDAATPDDRDDDGDGVSVCAGDCDDNDPDKYPNQTWYPDCDNDGAYSSVGTLSCDVPSTSDCSNSLPPAGGWSLQAGNDCHDGDPTIHPGATDIPNNDIDEDCDGFDATSCCINDRGNINGDILDAFDISDVVYFVDFMFNDGDPISCDEEADVVVDISIDISDVVFLVDYMFNDGAAPPACP